MEKRGQCTGRNRILSLPNNPAAGTCRYPSFAGSSCRNLSRRNDDVAHRPLRGNIAREAEVGKKDRSTRASGKIEELAWESGRAEDGNVRFFVFLPQKGGSGWKGISGR